jgi:hypothetical protein
LFDIAFWWGRRTKGLTLFELLKANNERNRSEYMEKSFLQTGLYFLMYSKSLCLALKFIRCCQITLDPTNHAFFGCLGYSCSKFFKLAPCFHSFLCLLFSSFAVLFWFPKYEAKRMGKFHRLTEIRRDLYAVKCCGTATVYTKGYAECQDFSPVVRIGSPRRPLTRKRVSTPWFQGEVHSIEIDTLE